MLNTSSWLTLAVADVVGVNTASPMLHNDGQQCCYATKSNLATIYISNKAVALLTNFAYINKAFAPNTSSI